MKLESLGEFRVQTLRETPPEQWKSGKGAEPVMDYYRNVICQEARYNPEQEQLHCIHLSPQSTIMGHHLIGLGTRNSVISDPCGVFKPAIVAGSSAVVLVHNHPSTNPTPSPQDIAYTARMKVVADLLEIPLMDHFVAGEVSAKYPKGYVSIRNTPQFEMLLEKLCKPMIEAVQNRN